MKEFHRMLVDTRAVVRGVTCPPITGPEAS